MNPSPELHSKPSRAALRATLLGIVVGVPAWTMLYMCVIRPAVFGFIMSLLGWDSISVPIGLHVLVVLGLPFGIFIGVEKLLKLRRKQSPTG
jgi:hypothetical protein